jgi:glycerophosphoryl diester phosphodiesterase
MRVRLVSACAAAAGALMLLPSLASGFDLQGHRGARGLAPENTIAGFSKALEIGVSTLEFDTVMTADGKLVLGHDPRLHPDLTRDQFGRWLRAPGPLIKSLSWKKLQRYKLGKIRPGSRYARRFPDQQPVDDAKFATLQQLFDLVRDSGNETVRLNIEAKTSPEKPDDTPMPHEFVDALLEAIGRAGYYDRVTIQSFDWRTLAAVRKIQPSIATACLTAEQSWLDNIQRGKPGPSPWTAGLDIDSQVSLPHMVKRFGCKIWSPYHKDLDQMQLSLAKAIDIEVVPWTVNDTASMNRLIDLGVDGLITDYPDRLRQIMSDRGMALPKPVAPPEVEDASEAGSAAAEAAERVRAQ